MATAAILNGRLGTSWFSNREKVERSKSQELWAPNVSNALGEFRLALMFPTIRQTSTSLPVRRSRDRVLQTSLTSPDPKSQSKQLLQR